MSLFSLLADRNKVKSLEEAFRAQDITSSEMKEAIDMWFSLYFEGGTPKDEDDCQRLPVLVVHKLCKTMFAEYSVSVSGNKKSFIEPLLRRLDKIRKKAVQMELTGGEAFIKPVLYGNSFDFVVLRRDCFVPLARDSHGTITSVGTSETVSQSGKYYTLLERRTALPNGTLSIENRLFVSEEKSVIGREVPLNTLERYASLEPEILLPGIYNLGMVQLKTPLMNCVDGTDDGVSVYAPAVGLIRNVNRNERQMDEEFDNGASRIIASADMVTTDKSGRKRLSDSLFVAVDDDPETVGVTVYSPALREASYLARKQEYLRNIESLIGLKRGILSEVEAAERTAKEITSSEGDYSLTIQDFQEGWEESVRELLSTCDRLGRVYHICGEEAFDPQKDIAVDWGNGILYDESKIWSDYKYMVGAGLLKPEIAVAWYFNLPWKTEKDIQRIRETYMPQMEALTEG